MLIQIEYAVFPWDTFAHRDFDLDRDRDLEREWWEPSFDPAGEWAGERLADFPEPRGLALLDAELDSWMDHTHQHMSCQHQQEATKWIFVLPQYFYSMYLRINTILWRVQKRI